MFAFSGWLLFATILIVFWGLTGVTQKLSTNRISSELSFLWFAYAMIAISVVLVMTVRMHWSVSSSVLWLAIAGGTLNGLGALDSFAALESGGKASVVISLYLPIPAADRADSRRVSARTPDCRSSGGRRFWRSLQPSCFSIKKGSYGVEGSIDHLSSHDQYCH